MSPTPFGICIVINKPWAEQSMASLQMVDRPTRYQPADENSGRIAHANTGGHAGADPTGLDSGPNTDALQADGQQRSRVQRVSGRGGRGSSVC